MMMRSVGVRRRTAVVLVLLFAHGCACALASTDAPAPVGFAACQAEGGDAGWRSQVCGLIGAGRIAEAVLMLQRRLALEPADPSARALLEEALSRLGAAAAAREVPGNAGLEGRPRWERGLALAQPAAWLAGEVGHDSNINSATGLAAIDLPLLNYRSLALSPLLVRRPSGFIGLAGGAAAARPLSPSFSVNVAAQAAARYNASEAGYLPQSYQARLGAQWRLGALLLEGAAALDQRRVARYHLIDRSETGLTARFDAILGVEFAAAAFTSRQKYPLFDGLHTRSRGLALHGRHAASGLALGLSVARERSAALVRDLDRDATAVSLEWSGEWRGVGRALVQLVGVRSAYLEPSALFATQRLDKAATLTLALARTIGDGWTLTPRLVLEENVSSIPLVAFRRRQVMAELRRDW